MLTAAEIASWIGRPQSETETVWILDLRRWVAEVLAPRHRELKQHLATKTDKSSELAS